MLRNVIILISREKTKPMKSSKIITQQLKATENPNFVDINQLL